MNQESNILKNEQAEIEKIKDKYIDKKIEETKLDKIKKLDKKPTKYGLIAALVTGTISSLIFGSGMSLALVIQDYSLGILVGLIGAVGMILSYPIYKWIFKICKNEVKDEILELCNSEITE